MVRRDQPDYNSDTLAAYRELPAILVAVGAALWIVNWLVLRGERSTPHEEHDERNDRERE